MKKNNWLISDLLLIVILTAFDQITKSWAVKNLKDTEGIDLIKNVLKLYYLPNGNTGAAFGILSGHRFLFLFIAVIVVTAILIALTRIPPVKKHMLLRLMLVLIAAGGIGNMLDRIRLSYVIDFIYFYLINFPIFNVADCYVTIAVIITSYLIIFKYKEDDFKDFKPLFKKQASSRDKESPYKEADVKVSDIKGSENAGK